MTNPTLVATPFANSGTKNTIPESVPLNPQNATMQAGFPAITQTPISTGGIPPERADFNGILNLYGQHIVHLNKGLPYLFDAAFATTIGGYPIYSRIMLTNGDIVKSTVANNTANPNSDMTGWVKINSTTQIFDPNGTSQDSINSLNLTIKYYGAVGDGTLHPLSEKYATLAAAQVVYPHATSLTDSIDWAALQKAINVLPYSSTSTINPKNDPNGGRISVPRGKYILNRKITLKRGVYIVGESRESTQFWSLNSDGLFEYDDAGRYLPDEICMFNLSLWQDASVVATSGAGIKIRSSGLVPEASVSFKLDNLIIEGFYNNLNVGDGINAVLNRVDQSKAVSHGCIFDSQYFTTSSSLNACYAHSNGGSGWVFNKLYYVDLGGMASDSNGQYGYEFIDCRATSLRGGAESNSLKAVKIKNSYGMSLTIGAINNLTGAIDLDNAQFTALIGCMLTGTVGTAIVGTNAANRLKIFATDFEGNYTANRISNVAGVEDASISTSLQTDGKNWQIGTAAALQATSQWKYDGVVTGTESAIVDVQTTFLPTAAPTGQYSAQKITWRGQSTGSFPISCGQYISNNLVSGGGSAARKIGQQLDKQTGGTSANAALYLSMGSALAVGNWSAFNDIDLPSYFKDKIKFGATASTAPYITSGVGVPSDSTAPTGSLYTRTDGGTLTTLYVKEPTGWVAK